LYGKIFAKMYEGTLYGQWEALVTFQQMIVLCDADGMIDMTPPAIASRTSIPLEIIEKGIKILESPDQYSRTPDQEGRRIELIDAHRPWGWHIVNHAKYLALQDADMVRHQTRERVRKHRAAKEGVTVTDGNGSKRHTDTDKDIDTDKGKTTTPPPSGAFLKFWGLWPKGERKKAQGKCWELWRRKDFDQVADAILSHVDSLKRSDGWRSGFVPMPMTYLNAREWEGADLVEDSGPRVAMP
jgi:hypothetical protein